MIGRRYSARSSIGIMPRQSMPDRKSTSKSTSSSSPMTCSRAAVQGLVASHAESAVKRTSAVCRSEERTWLK